MRPLAGGLARRSFNRLLGRRGLGLFGFLVGVRRRRFRLGRGRRLGGWRGIGFAGPVYARKARRAALLLLLAAVGDRIFSAPRRLLR